MTTDPRSALERLTRWRDAGAGMIHTRPAFEDFAESVLALLSLLDWRPISEAPKDGTSIMTFPHYAVTHWAEGGWVDEWDEGEECWKHLRPQPVYFLPLPPAPQEDKP